MPKTIKIPTHEITLYKSWNEKGEYVRGPDEDRSNRRKAILMVGNLNVAGFSIGLVPPGSMDREYTGGPLVPGPRAHASPHASVIDNEGGTGAIIRRAREAILVYDARIGDYLDLDGHVFEIRPAPNRNLDLAKVDAPPFHTSSTEVFLGISTLHRFMLNGKLHALKSGGVGIDCRDVPPSTLDHLRQLGWTWDLDVSVEDGDAICVKYHFKD